MPLGSRSIIVAAPGGGAALVPPVAVDQIPVVSSVAPEELTGSHLRQRLSVPLGAAPVVQVGDNATGNNQSPGTVGIAAPRSTGAAVAGSLSFVVGAVTTAISTPRGEVVAVRIGQYDVGTGNVGLFLDEDSGGPSRIIVIGIGAGANGGVVPGSGTPRLIVRGDIRLHGFTDTESRLRFTRFNGTPATPTPTVAFNVIPGVAFSGRTSDGAQVDGAYIDAFARENFTGSFAIAAGTGLRFLMRPPGSSLNPPVPAMTVQIDANETVLLGNQNTFRINGQSIRFGDFSGGNAGAMGFFGQVPVTRPSVPIGSTTDAVITALQALGLFGP